VSGLLTSSQLGALSKLVKQGMTTTVTIYDHVVTRSADGMVETWVARSETEKCWFYTSPTNSMAVALGLQATPNVFRLFFETDTVIATADRVEVGGKFYTVIDTTHENTIQAMLTVNVRSMD
jgi:hypothetical protein